jgi:class 3 adenylate cyclase/HAMP domain-containing protein
VSSLKKQYELSEVEFNNTTTTTVEAIRLSLEVGLREENYESIEKIFDWATKRPSLECIVLTSVDEGEETVYVTFPDDYDPDASYLAQRSQDSSIDADTVIRSSPLSTEAISGNVYLCFSTQTLQDQYNELIKSAFLRTLGIIIFTLFLTYFPAVKISKPLEELRQVSQQIASGHLEVRANENITSKELKSFARGFNVMIERLLTMQKERVSELNSWNEQLEEKNDSLTKVITELTDANLEIQRQQNVLQEQSQKIELANTELQEVNLVVQEERNKAEQLLLNVLPESIAQRLKSGETVIADNFDCVTVLFADIANFTPLSASISAKELVELLNTIFTEFDQVMEDRGLEKIKTIGDAYMAVAGVPNFCQDHARRAALDMQKIIENTHKTDPRMKGVVIRVGMHSGPVIAGVIGKSKFIYDLWGDTVNTASRMESHGVPSKIHVSNTMVELLPQEFKTEPRGLIEVKGKGKMETFFLLPGEQS